MIKMAPLSFISLPKKHLLKLTFVNSPGTWQEHLYLTNKTNKYDS